MSEQLKALLTQYTDGIHEIYGQELQSVILYGSYARGDNREDSDVDIMILVNLEEELIQQTRERLSIYTYNFNMDYDMEIMPVIKDIKHFKYWSKVYPYYKNVEEEGVELYVS